jgi:hypothetical protein
MEEDNGREALVAGGGDRQAPVSVKAYLVDPQSMRVTWLNESAKESMLEADAEALTVERAVPMAGPLAMAEAVRRVADGGEPEHVRTDVISVRRGSMGINASIYRLPDGMVLVLAEQGWQNAAGTSERTAGTPRRRR